MAAIVPEQAGPGANYNALSVHVAGIPARLAPCHRDVRQLRWLRELGRTGMAGALREGWRFCAPLGTADLLRHHLC